MRLFRSRNFQFATLKTPEINPFEPFAWTPGICNNDNKGQGTILTDLLHNSKKIFKQALHIRQFILESYLYLINNSMLFNERIMMAILMT
jgi:hypothetical protein